MALSPTDFANRCEGCDRRPFWLCCDGGDDAMRRLDEIGINEFLPSRTVVFREGELASRVFVVCEGLLKLSTVSRNGRIMILRLASAGDFLGLSAALSNERYEGTAETLQPTILKWVHRLEFLELLQSCVQVGKATSRVLAKEYGEVSQDFRRLALSRSASGRLARLLLDWSTTTVGGKTKLQLTTALTHDELASMAGASRETVTRLLNRFERNGWITRRSDSITILNPNQLEL